MNKQSSKKQSGVGRRQRKPRVPPVPRHKDLTVVLTNTELRSLSEGKLRQRRRALETAGFPARAANVHRIQLEVRAAAREAQVRVAGRRKPIRPLGVTTGLWSDSVPEELTGCTDLMGTNYPWHSVSNPREIETLDFTLEASKGVTLVHVIDWKWLSKRLPFGRVASEYRFSLMGLRYLAAQPRADLTVVATPNMSTTVERRRLVPGQFWYDPKGLGVSLQVQHGKRPARLQLIFRVAKGLRSHVYGPAMFDQLPVRMGLALLKARQHPLSKIITLIHTHPYEIKVPSGLLVVPTTSHNVEFVAPSIVPHTTVQHLKLILAQTARKPPGLSELSAVDLFMADEDDEDLLEEKGNSPAESNSNSQPQGSTSVRPKMVTVDTMDSPPHQSDENTVATTVIFKGYEVFSYGPCHGEGFIGYRIPFKDSPFTFRVYKVDQQWATAGTPLTLRQVAEAGLVIDLRW